MSDRDPAPSIDDMPDSLDPLAEVGEQDGPPATEDPTDPNAHGPIVQA